MQDVSTKLMEKLMANDRRTTTAGKMQAQLGCLACDI